MYRRGFGLLEKSLQPIKVDSMTEVMHMSTCEHLLLHIEEGVISGVKIYINCTTTLRPLTLEFSLDPRKKEHI